MRQLRTVGEDKPLKTILTTPFMAYLVGVSLTVGALALPLSNFSSRPITPSLSCQLSVSLSEQFCFKKLEKATEAAGKVNTAVHAISTPLPHFLPRASLLDLSALVFISGHVCFKKLKKAKKAAGKLNLSVHAPAPPLPHSFPPPQPPPPTLSTFGGHRPLINGYTLGDLGNFCTTSCQTPDYLSCLWRPPG